MRNLWHLLPHGLTLVLTVASVGLNASTQVFPGFAVVLLVLVTLIVGECVGWSILLFHGLAKLSVNLGNNDRREP